MKQIVAVNASPRVQMNTGSLIRQAAAGAEAEGAQVQVFDLYRLDAVHGCMSCFACKLNEGKCVYRDGLAPVLEAIRASDGLVIGTPNYLGDASAGFRALFERLVFQSLTYQRDPFRYPFRKIPVLFVMTSNSPQEYYGPAGYEATVSHYQSELTGAVGPTKVMIVGNTLQVKDYSRFHWTIFDVAAKQAWHEKVFPEELKQAYELGAQMVRDPWGI